MTGETSFNIDEVDRAKGILNIDNSEVIAIFFEDKSLIRDDA
jgi:hypothetical protein